MDGHSDTSGTYNNLTAINMNIDYLTSQHTPRLDGKYKYTEFISDKEPTLWKLSRHIESADCREDLGFV